MSVEVTASCHCGATAVRATLPNGLADASRCTCSFCKRRQAAAVTATTASVVVTKGADNLQLYSWGTGTAKHYFCKTCGIYLYHQRRSDPAQCGINLGCIKGVDTWEHDPIPWTDGVNHPSDRK
ncbi:GFA family protein [Sulfitobacter donghicola]|uniref:Aldehyde-activating protein n=1 Tax=Sulfitobacter donghicola DSW-25 = KCTC 12864 = JCM 14565 TaxID=1300350 RepID=A0A073IV00_9RHOB|nr:GFA family protein [Sulfitobacter donghicola]KEJ89217.1 aldehyde-activating protein [Sulfitobacter donghicola DSW-25 = KCTC 12864 = JCM 14565]KIN69009.1 Glutathione-dependent formaldehyde-activating, GFA [Sulfitobacter donghicola DSW-25 = KCTC 12864 = JCM 14565]